MIRTVLRRIVPCLVTAASLLALVVPTSALAQGAAGEYRFSPVNQYAINLAAAFWNPIITYVSDKSGVKMSLKLGRTSADTTAYVLANEVEFIFSNYMFSPEREKLGWKVFGRRKTPPSRSQLIVPADSSITDLSQLEGKAVSFPGPEALIGYKIPYAAILAKGIEVQVVFGGNQDSALVQLFSGKVQATGGNAQLLAGYAKREGKSFRVLWSSDPVQDLALMASSRVPEKDVKAVARAFFGMDKNPKGHDILHYASLEVGLTADASFVPSDGSEYVTERRFFQTAPPQLR